MVIDDKNPAPAPVPPTAPAPSTFKDDEDVSIEQFEEAARQKYKIPKNLLQAMLKQESNGGTDLTSPTGVQGKYQVTQATAQEWGKANGIPNADRNNPYHQAAAGLWYLRKNFDETTDVPDTNARWLSSVGKYYGGPGAVKGGVADTESRDGVSNPAVHITRVGNNWKALGLDGDQDPVQLPEAKVIPTVPTSPLPEPGQTAQAAPAQDQERQELLKAIGAAEQEFPTVAPEKDATTASQEAYAKFLGDKVTGFDKDVADTSILFSKPGAEAATGFDPDKKVVSSIDPGTFPVQIVSASKDPEKEFIYQYFNRLGLQPKQTDEFIQSTGWHLFDPQSLQKNLENFRIGVQAALPLDVSAATAAQVDAYKSGGPEAAKLVTDRLNGIKNRFDSSKHVITDAERQQYVPYAAQVGAALGNILGVNSARGGVSGLDVARGMAAMKLGAYQTSKENIQFWNNITGGVAFPELSKKMESGFRNNYALLNQINKSMTTGESFAEQGVATSGMLLRNVAAGSVIAATLPVAGAGAIAGTSAYNLADTFISNLHEAPETMKNAMVNQAVLLGIPWATKLAGGILGKYIGKTALTAANVAEAAKVMKPAPLFSMKELGVATVASSAYMGASTKAGGGSNNEAYAAALLGLALPVSMHLGAEAVNTVKGLKAPPAAPESQVQVDFKALPPETQQQLIEMTAQGLQHPLISNLIQTATAERAAQLGIDANAVKMAFDAQEALSTKRTAMGGLPVPIDPIMRDQYRQVLEINAGLHAEYAINGLGAIGVASMTGNDAASVVPIAKRSPMVSTTHHIGEIIKEELGTSVYDPEYSGASVTVENAQKIATKLLTHSDPSAVSFAQDLQKQIDYAKGNNWDRVGVVNVEQPGEIAGSVATHENVHNVTSRAIENPIRAKAKEDSTKVLSDLELTDKLAKTVGDQRAAVLQQEFARQVGNVNPIATEKPTTVAVSGEQIPKNRAVKNLDVRNRTLSGILRNSEEASRLQQHFDNALKEEGYLLNPETAGVEQVYEPIANLTEKSFLKKHNISPQQAEALVIAELTSFNTDSQAARQLAEHLPFNQRKAYLDFLENPLTNKYETKTATKATAPTPSPAPNDIAPEGRGSSAEPVPEPPAQPATPEQGRSTEQAAGTGPATPRQEGTPPAKLEAERPSTASTGAERELPKPGNQESTVKEPSKYGVMSEGEVKWHRQQQMNKTFSKDFQEAPKAHPKTEKFVADHPQFKEKQVDQSTQPSLLGGKPVENVTKHYSQVEKALQNVEENYATRGIAPRMREFLKGQGVDVDKFERSLKGEPEPLPAPSSEIKTQLEAPKAPEKALPEAKEGPQPKVPAELTKELNNLRQQFKEGKLAYGSTVELSNGVKVVVPKEVNQFTDIVAKGLDEGEAYGRTAQLIRRHWSSKGEGGDQAVTAVLDKFNLPGEASSREAQDLAHRAIVKSFNNPKMSPETVGSLVQSEMRAGKEVPEVGLNQIPASDLYRWAKTRNLVDAFPKDIMSIGGDVSNLRKGNQVSLYSRKGVGVPDEGETHNVSRTSVKQVPELLRVAPIPKGSRNIDIGGGKYDLGVEALKERGVTSKVIDPYSRDAAHNAAVEAEYKKKPADTATVANVLNVIKEPAIRKSVIENAGKYVKDGGKIYFDVYEGNSKGVGAATKVGTWQENRKIATYVDEIKSVYPDAKLVKNGSSRYIEATNSKDIPLYSRSPKDKSISHSNEALDGKKMIGRTSDGRAIVPNPENKSGVSIVKDQSFRETPTWDTSVPLYSRYGNGMNPKEAFQAKVAALYSEKNFEQIPVNKKNEVRRAFSVAQAAWNRGDVKAFQKETFNAVYKLDEIIGETKSKAQKLAEVGVTGVRLNPLINVPARAADITGTNINVQTQQAMNPAKRFVAYIAETYIAPKAVAAKNAKEKTNSKLLEKDPISKTIPKLHAQDWMNGTLVGAVEGAKDAKEIATKGSSTFQLQTGMSYNFDRSQTGWVGTDKVINRLAGVVGNAPDAFARGISFDIVVRQFAREHALQYPEAQRAAEFKKFYENVPEEIVGLATALTEKYTYNNPNAAAEMVHTYIDKFAPDGSKAAMHHAANLAYRYVRVPTNVAAQTARISGVTGPGLLAWDTYQLYNNLFKSYDTNTGKFGMTLAERRIAVEKITESSMGAMLMAGVAAGILAFGSDNEYVKGVKKNVAGSYDDQDQKAGKREEVRQLEPGAATVAGKTVKPQTLGPYQRVAQFQKDIFKGTGYQGLEEGTLKSGDASTLRKSYSKAALGIVEDFPLVGGTVDLVKNNFTEKKTDYARTVADALTIGGARDIGAFKDPIRRVTREGSIIDNLKNNYGMGKDLPAKVDSAGEPITKRSISNLFTKDFPDSTGLNEIERLGLSLPRHAIKEKGATLTVEEQAEKAAYLGKKLKESADVITASKEYQALPDDQSKAFVLNDAIQQVNNNPDLTSREAFHNARINSEFYKKKADLAKGNAFKKLTASQQQAAEAYLKSQFHKYSIDSEKKEKGDASTFDLYADFRDFLSSDFSDAVLEAVDRASEKKKLPYERPKK